jgi:PIG-X / PBN1
MLGSQGTRIRIPTSIRDIDPGTSNLPKDTVTPNMSRQRLSCRLLLLLTVSCLYKARGATDKSITAAAPVVITLRKYSASNNGGPLILHGLCYLTVNRYYYRNPDGITSDRSKLDSSDCCHLLLQGIETWSSNTSAKSAESNSNLENVRQSCLQEIVQIPTEPQQHPPHIVSVVNGTVSRLPIFSVWYTSAMMESSSSLLIQQPSKRHERQSVTSDDSHCNLWHFSAFASGYNHDKARSKPLVRLQNPAANVEQPAANGWAAFVESNLAASGGLHRDLEHCITLTSPPPSSHAHGSLDTTGIMQVSLYLLIHLPSDLFVNVEDLFLYSNDAATTAASWNVTLVPPLTVIDQEEPAFVSPAHALLVRVSARLGDDSSREWMPPPRYTMQFVTKLHVRYPKPFAAAYNKSANFRRVMLPQPELLTGAVIRHHSTGMEMFNIHVQACLPSSTFLYPLELWIAAGHQYQYAFVWWMTLLVAIAGALVMLKDIAAASTWE